MGSKYGVFAQNGSMALYLGLRAIDIGPGDEVIVPNFTFIASANAVEMCGATPVFVDINRDADAEVKVLYKILRVDDAFDFDEMDFKFFNDDGTVSGSGGPDVAVRPSEGRNEFLEHEYTAGVKDDGIGTSLEEFIAFQIKIVMRTTNQAQPPLLQRLRVLALAT